MCIKVSDNLCGSIAVILSDVNIAEEGKTIPMVFILLACDAISCCTKQIGPRIDAKFLSTNGMRAGQLISFFLSGIVKKMKLHGGKV